MNFDRLRHVSERADIGESSEIILGVTIDEKPGSFKKFCSIIGKELSQSLIIAIRTAKMLKFLLVLKQLKVLMKKEI